MALALAGCQSTVAKAPSGAPAAPKPKDEPVALATGRIEISARDEKGAVAWVVRAKSGRASVALEEGIGPAELQDVEGEVYDRAAVVSRFSAELASADKTTRRLELHGAVRVVSLRDSVTMSSDRVRWMDARGLVEAQGNVRFSSDVWSLGPFQVQWASKDLATIGSPDQFP